MTVPLAVAILIVGLGLLTLATGLGGTAVRRTRPQESATAPPTLQTTSPATTQTTTAVTQATAAVTQTATSAEAQAAISATISADNPVATPAAPPADTPAATSAVGSSDAPATTSSDIPVATSANIPVATSADTPVATSATTSATAPSSGRATGPAGIRSTTYAITPADIQATAPADIKAPGPADRPAEPPTVHTEPPDASAAPTHPFHAAPAPMAPGQAPSSCAAPAPPPTEPADLAAVTPAHPLDAAHRADTDLAHTDQSPTPSADTVPARTNLGPTPPAHTDPTRTVQDDAQATDSNPVPTVQDPAHSDTERTAGLPRPARSEVARTSAVTARPDLTDLGRTGQRPVIADQVLPLPKAAHSGIALPAAAVCLGGSGPRQVETESARVSFEAPRTDPVSGEQGRSSRALWVGAGVSAGLGTGALVVASFVLISAVDAPANVLSAPPAAGGLRRDDSAGTRRLISRQREHLKEAGMPNPLTAVYRRTGVTTTTVLFIGSSGRIGDPAARLRDFLSGVADSTGASGRQPRAFPAGRLKGTVLCLDQLMSGEATLTTCGWADDGTLGVITTDDGDSAKTAGLLLSMRDDMERTS